MFACKICVRKERLLHSGEKNVFKPKALCYYCSFEILIGTTKEIMMEIQAIISQWLGQLAQYLPFGYAFGAGMVSAVNPCGFAMLPVYLSLYLGSEDVSFREHSLFYRLLKGVGIGLVVSAGFSVLFGIVGALVSFGGSFLMRFIPWLALLVGIGLILMGVWMLSGRSLSSGMLEGLGNRIGDPSDISVRGFFLFGLAFGATSLGCTLPVFLMVVGSSMTSSVVVSSLLQFVGYILGMTTVILLLTVGISVVKEGVVVGTMRRILPYVEKISAILLLLAGGYISWYWLSSGLLLRS